jgi:hypothetical protein
MTKPSRAKRVAVLNDKIRKSLLTGSVGFTRKSATGETKGLQLLEDLCVNYRIPISLYRSHFFRREAHRIPRRTGLH